MKPPGEDGRKSTTTGDDVLDTGNAVVPHPTELRSIWPEALLTISWLDFGVFWGEINEVRDENRF